ncbi:S1C family serine protease [Herpetosiphon giganteus]|uniref:S1C family serine protease n=1 Tax=Herpetosiphon giganteus TaxID=2029754 RepID=UPI001956EC87|nr:trypsin-like peptidase domain-containing protein [Herpetosiphon giganteus]MBM7846019.1 S1-C subfamily serine protease [Herpetosiphon giganteus]
MKQRSMRVLIPAFLIPLGLCILGSILIWIFAPNEQATPEQSTNPNTTLSAEPTPVAVSPVNANPSNDLSDEQARIDLYKRVGPAVVSIDTEVAGESSQEVTQEALGSGFLVDDQGHIATNNHVIEGATRIFVTFSDGRQVPASLRGADQDNDIAVIKVEAEEVSSIAPMVFGNSREVQVGQDTIAIGNPFGLQNTMTLGIVSAVEGRSLPGRTLANGGQFRISRIIQTDAAINPGNSGGPLLNSNGEVIGINTAIRVSDPTAAPAFAGVGYAVPANTVKIIVEDLIKTGKHDSAYLGVSMLTISSQLAEELKLPVNQGALVTNVVVDGPADQAGIRLGTNSIQVEGAELIIDSDIVTAFNGERIRSSDDLIAHINDSRVGDKVNLTIIRGEEEQTVEVTLGARP